MANDQVLLYKKMGSSIRFDVIEIVIGTYFPTQVVVWVTFSSSEGKQFDSKSKLLNYKKFVLLRNWKIESV